MQSASQPSLLRRFAQRLYEHRLQQVMRDIHLHRQFLGKHYEVSPIGWATLGCCIRPRPPRPPVSWLARVAVSHPLAPRIAMLGGVERHDLACRFDLNAEIRKLF